MHRDTWWIGYARALIRPIRTIDPRQKFRPATTPATRIAAKGSERYRLFDTIKVGGRGGKPEKEANF